jgi:hypothetical protein
MTVMFELTAVLEISVTLKANSDWEHGGEPLKQCSVSNGTSGGAWNIFVELKLTCVMPYPTG